MPQETRDQAALVIGALLRQRTIAVICANDISLLNTDTLNVRLTATGAVKVHDQARDPEQANPSHARSVGLASKGNR
jgi:hypothetical protein